MNAHTSSLVNAILLIGLGLWGYFDSSSNTALIPVIFGVAILACNPGVKKENKVIAHIAVLLTVLVVLGLAMAFKGTIARLDEGTGDTLAVVRVGIMMLSSLVAIGYFVKSFIDARKAREAGE
jgi:hypothetical protein